MSTSVIGLIPIYKPELSPLERFSLERSLSCLSNREIRFIGPENLAVDYYSSRYPEIAFEPFPVHCFSSIQEYNRLLLNIDFYARFEKFEFMLVLQTDAIVLNDELDFWCSRPFDYIGAPWPEGWELFVNAGKFDGANGKRLRVYVGNGGLSLRRISACRRLLREFAGDVVDVFHRTGSSEDLFFAFMGALSEDFIIPNEITASRFSLELRPSYYFAVNGGRLPMGAHGWWKSEPAFWRTVLPDAPYGES